MDDEERLLCCQREIFRLRGVVRILESEMQQYEAELKEEMGKEGMEQPGLKRALEIWQEILKE